MHQTWVDGIRDSLRRFVLQAKEKGYHAGRDEQYDTLILDEAAMDKVS